MFDSESVRNRLLKEFLLAKSKNPRFSMRAYAKKLGLSQATLSQIMSGKRAISKNAAETILRALGEDTFEISKTLHTIYDPPTETCRPLLGDEFNIVSEWHYFAILSLSNTQNFQSEPRWIAQRLGLTEQIVHEALETLLKIGLLVKDSATGVIRESGAPIEAISKVPSAALKKANEQNIQLAKHALSEVAVDSRDYTAVTLCFDPKNMDEARKLIKKFRRNFAEIMEVGQKKEVYKLCIQLFPLTGRKHA